MLISKSWNFFCFLDLQNPDIVFFVKKNFYQVSVQFFSCFLKLLIIKKDEAKKFFFDFLAAVLFTILLNLSVNKKMIFQ